MSSPLFVEESYLSQLRIERQQFIAWGLGSGMPNTLRMLDAEIERVVQLSSQAHVKLTETIPIPGDESDARRLVGRILGPGGLTVRRLEGHLGVSIRVRGKGSCRSPTEEAEKSVLKGWEHLAQPLHVLISAEGGELVTRERLGQAARVLRDILSPQQQCDLLKRCQLAELALQRGNYVVNKQLAQTVVPDQGPQTLNHFAPVLPIVPINQPLPMTSHAPPLPLTPAPQTPGSEGLLPPPLPLTPAPVSFGSEALLPTPPAIIPWLPPSPSHDSPRPGPGPIFPRNYINVRYHPFNRQ